MYVPQMSHDLRSVTREEEEAIHTVVVQQQQ